MDQSFSGDETNRDYHYGYLDVLWFRVLDSSDVNIITLNSRKNPRKHEKRKISWLLTHIVPSPVPQHKKAQIRKPSVCSAEVGRFQRPTRQRNAQKGGQGRSNEGFFAFRKGERISLLFFGVRGRDSGAERPAVEYPISGAHIRFKVVRQERITFPNFFS